MSTRTLLSFENAQESYGRHRNYYVWGVTLRRKARRRATYTRTLLSFTRSLFDKARSTWARTSISVRKVRQTERVVRRQADTRRRKMASDMDRQTEKTRSSRVCVLLDAERKK